MSATGGMRRSDFGPDFGGGILGDVVRSRLDVEFLEAQAG